MSGVDDLVKPACGSEDCGGRGGGADCAGCGCGGGGSCGVRGRSGVGGVGVGVGVGVSLYYCKWVICVVSAVCWMWLDVMGAVGFVVWFVMWSFLDV